MSSTPEQAAPPLPEEIKPPAWLEVLRRFVQGDLASLRVFVVLALIWAIFQIENSHFLTAQNLTNLFLQITAVGLISVGVVYVLLLGEIDLSVGAVSGLAAAIMAVLNVKHGWSPYTAIAAGVVAGLVIGLVQGFFFPEFFGRPDKHYVANHAYAFGGLTPYIGAIPLMLGVAGLAVRRAPAQLLFAGLLAATILVVMNSAAVSDALRPVPELSQMNLVFLLVLVPFSAAILAAYGFQELLSAQAEPAANAMQIPTTALAIPNPLIGFS